MFTWFSLKRDKLEQLERENKNKQPANLLPHLTRSNGNMYAEFIIPIKNYQPAPQALVLFSLQDINWKEWHYGIMTLFSFFNESFCHHSRHCTLAMTNFITRSPLLPVKSRVVSQCWGYARVNSTLFFTKIMKFFTLLSGSLIIALLALVYNLLLLKLNFGITYLKKWRKYNYMVVVSLVAN